MSSGSASANDTNSRSNGTSIGSTATNSNVRTAVAILLNNNSSNSSNNSSSKQPGGANVVLWACQESTSSTTSTTSGSCSLTYYHYWDHGHLFQHTDALLQRLPNVAVVHVASYGSAELSQQPGETQTPQGMTKRLIDSIQNSLQSASLLSHSSATQDDADDDDSDGNDNDAQQRGAAPESVWHYHSSFSTPSAADVQTRLPGLLQQRLHPNSHRWMQFCGDVQWQQHPVIAHALIFYLQCTQQWPTTTHNNSSTSNNNMPPLEHLRAGVLESCLSMDRTAADAIHLWPSGPVQGGTPDTSSIYGMLAAHCQTAAGKWLLQQWLRQPSVCRSELALRQEAVATLVQSHTGRDAIRSEGLRLLNGSGKLADLSRLAATLALYAVPDDQDNNTNSTNNNNTNSTNNKMTPPRKNTRRALMALYQLYLVSSQKIPLLTETLQTALDEGEMPQSDSHNDNNTTLLADVLATLQHVSTELARSVELIEAVLDLEQAPREYLVQADYKPELQDIVQELQQVETELEACHQHMNQVWADVCGGNNNPQAVRLERSDDNNNNTWQFRLLDKNDSKILQSQLAGTVQVHKLLKNGVYFTTKQLRQLSQQQQDLRAEYDRHQAQVVQDAAAVAATYAPVLERAAEAVAHLDVLCALAHHAAHHNYCRPVLTDSEEDGAGICLQQARHPCVERQEGVDFIPNDYNLVFGESSFLIVTGPNMGGKSTYIRALGAIVTLAQIGSFVPCTSATINICHHILARVGAGDLQERGISTFMAEMLESASILRTASKRSLIIVDELGRGTSTFDGFGLARAISEHIVQEIGCITVFATHFHELTVLEDQEPSVQNCHVTAQTGSQGLTFLYEVKPGPCLESFGIQVAAMAHVPNSVIQDAKRRARELEKFEYRKKVCTATTTNDEEMANAQAWVDRLRNLPKEILHGEYASMEERRDAILRAMGEE